MAIATTVVIQSATRIDIAENKLARPRNQRAATGKRVLPSFADRDKGIP